MEIHQAAGGQHYAAAHPDRSVNELWMIMEKEGCAEAKQAEPEVAGDQSPDRLERISEA